MEPLYIPIADLFPFYAFWRAAPKGRDGRERIKDTEMNISENNAGLILFHFQIPKTMLMSPQQMMTNQGMRPQVSYKDHQPCFIHINKRLVFITY